MNKERISKHFDFSLNKRFFSPLGLKTLHLTLKIFQEL